MPKKAKSKKGGKGKKGKGKGGKSGGKKKGKDASIKSMSEANSKMWETRLDLAERSRAEYRENNRRLLVENDTLQMQMHQTEKDTIDVITYLKRQDQDKDHQLDKMQNSVKDLKKDHRRETERVIDEFQQQISEVEQQLVQKTHEVEIMQSELKQVKEFRRKRAQMQKELEEIKEAMFSANKEHKDTLQRMEQKFFEEKMRLQQEANQKIAELAERAHTEAISNLDETTRSVYKENVRVSEALSYHMEEGTKLKKAKARLEEENETLRQEKEMNDMMIQEKVQQSRHQKDAIKQLQEKVDTLEKSLSHVVHEFEVERKSLVDRSRIENESSRVEIAKLQRMLELKSREMNKVKKLARNILDERTEMERFFLEALEHVKTEISANRIQYRKAAQVAYQQKMIAAHTGRAEFPRIRTFNKADNSTNSVFRDLEAAEKLRKEFEELQSMDINGKVDISDLTWEQKERVLRFLFARINGNKGRRHTASAPSLGEVAVFDEPQEAWSKEAADEDGPGDSTFLTQAAVGEPGAGRGAEHTLPQIGPTSTALVEVGAPLQVA